MKPKFFPTPADLRAWLADHHGDAAELLVGFRKKGSGKPSLTWSEAVDEALCFGWIDGVRHTLDAEAYTIRFTPRKADGIWSAKNIARVTALEKAGRMTAAGRRAFRARKAGKTGVYSFERDEPARLTLQRRSRARQPSLPTSRRRASHRRAGAWEGDDRPGLADKDPLRLSLDRDDLLRAL